MKQHFFMRQNYLGLQWALIGAVAMFALSGCSSDEPEIVTPVEPSPYMKMSAADEAIVKSQHDFSFSLLSELNKDYPGENVGFSPYCVQECLSILANGVSDEDQERFAAAFNMSDVAEMNDFCKRLNISMPLRDPQNVSISIANGLWINNKYNVNPAFVDVVRNNYAGDVQSSDFSKVSITDIVNKWVAEKTRNSIQNLLPKSLDGDINSTFVLANALSFEAKWKEGFDESETAPRPFTDSYGKNAKNVPTMHNRQNIQFGGNDMYSVARLYFGDSNYSIVFIIPDEGFTVKDVLAVASKDEIHKLFVDGQSMSAEVYLPKFSFKTDNNITSSLEKAGVPVSTVSYKNICDFNQEVEAFQGFSFSVDEEGAKVETATGVRPPATAIVLPNGELYVNRPFIFYITESSSQAMIGLGIVNDPTK